MTDQSDTPDWPALAAEWQSLRARSAGTREFTAARERAERHARRDMNAFWDWFLTLGPDDRLSGSLIRNILWSWRSAPVPKRAHRALVAAGVETRDPSFNRTFIEPAARAYPAKTVELLLDYLTEGTSFEQAGAANALYWALGFGGDELGPLRDRVRQTRLRRFVETDSVDVRRCIIPSLSLDRTRYPGDMHPLIDRAIEIARGSDDEYLRHRIEIQLGSGGAYLPLPERQPRDGESP